MRAVFILIIMIFLHLFADYHLQGILASMKQKEWWKQFMQDDATREMYGGDYKTALMAHSFEWSFIVTFPCLMKVYGISIDLSWSSIQIGVVYICVLLLNTFFHYIVDDLKCNDRKINLMEDQVLHFMQIVVSWMGWSAWMGW